MDMFFYHELRRGCREIDLDIRDEQKIGKVIEACERVIHFSELARKEGLLILEEEAEQLDAEDRTQAFLAAQISQILDGTDPKLIEEMGMNQIVVNHACNYDCLIFLLYHKGTLLIQQGINPRLTESYLLSLIPDFIAAKVRKRSKELHLQREKERKEELERLCEDNEKMNKSDYSIVNQTAVTLLELSNKEIQRILRETESTDWTIAMTVLPGKARKRIFDNLSQRLGVLIAEDMELIGVIRRKDAEAVCVKIMKKVIALSVSGEIASHDFSLLQLVIDLYETAQKENQKLRNQYKELYRLLEQIYQT